MYDHYFSNFGRPPISDDICKVSATTHLQFWRRRFLKVFPIQMHRVPSKRPCLKKSIYDLYFSNFGRPHPHPHPVPNDLSKDSAPRHPWFWRRRILKVFTIYGHGGHLGHRAATILAIFHTLHLRRLHIKFEQNWLRGSRGEVVWNSGHFSHTNAQGSKIDLSIKRSNVNVRPLF